MSQKTEPNCSTIISQALGDYKSILKRSILYSCIPNILFLIFSLYSLQVVDRVIGSGNIDTLLMLFTIIVVSLLVWVISTLGSHILLYRYIKKDSKIWLYTSGQSHARENQDLARLNLFLSGPSISIIPDAIWCILYFLIIFLIHPYVAIAATVGVILVAGFAYIKIITTNPSLREVTDFNAKDLKWYYFVQQTTELIMLIAPVHTIILCFLSIVYSWFKFHIMSKALKLSNKSYSNNSLSKFCRFLKAFLTILIKQVALILIIAVGSYVVISTHGVEMTTGGMIASSILMARISIATDNIVVIWPNIRNNYISYSNLKNEHTLTKTEY